MHCIDQLPDSPVLKSSRLASLIAKIANEDTRNTVHCKARAIAAGLPAFALVSQCHEDNITGWRRHTNAHCGCIFDTYHPDRSALMGVTAI